MVSLIQSVKAEVLPMATRLSLHIIPYFLSFQLLLLSPSLIAAGAAASVVSNSVWPHRWQPTRLPHPWDSPGKNTGVGCHFLLQCVKVKSLSHVQLLAPHGLQPTKLLRPWDFLGKSTGVGATAFSAMAYYYPSVPAIVPSFAVPQIHVTLGFLH